MKKIPLWLKFTGLALMPYAFAAASFATSMFFPERQWNWILYLLFWGSAVAAATVTADLIAHRPWRKWKRVIACISIPVLFVPYILLPYSIYFALFCICGPFSDGCDHFADDLKLPENVTLTEPLDERDMQDSGTEHFTLYNGVQGGRYVLDIRCNPGERGILYIKANEITRGTLLTDTSASRRNGAIINGSSDRTKTYHTQLNFVIYKGDWGKYYGGHIEVWFHPQSGAPDRKIYENDYRIQGWMR